MHESGIIITIITNELFNSVLNGFVIYMNSYSYRKTGINISKNATNTTLLLCTRITLSNIFPIDNIEYSLHIISANVLVLQIIRMFPNVNTK